MAPHLAAAEAGVVIELARIAASFERLAARADAVVVEGVGGWLVPLNDHDTVADLSVRLGLPVILVVGMRLGCINHALLTVKAIRDAGLPLAGWVANRSVPSMARFEENVAALATRVDAPLLGTVPHLADCAAPQVAERLDLDLLPGTSPR